MQHDYIYEFLVNKYSVIINYYKHENIIVGNNNKKFGVFGGRVLKMHQN
ncbi:hypothetical protein sm9_1540 [Methanobrevibacter millerae]|uniref:Uncharacterized protein n=1 Tax=Methanobrevibacter millerae TaxID=230361 RepID=A0A0U3CUH9_9EURY|nr:hypothetical protein sm9_1540 [Methanobrevibacter millerae]